MKSLDVGIIPQGGTALSEAIRTALTAFEKGNDNHKVMVLFTDGEDHDTDAGNESCREGSSKSRHENFHDRRRHAEGELLRAKDEQGQMGFVKDEKATPSNRSSTKIFCAKSRRLPKAHICHCKGRIRWTSCISKRCAHSRSLTTSANSTAFTRSDITGSLGIAIVLLIVEVFLPERKRVRSRDRAKSDGA